MFVQQWRDEVVRLARNQSALLALAQQPDSRDRGGYVRRLDRLALRAALARAAIAHVHREQVECLLVVLEPALGVGRLKRHAIRVGEKVAKPGERRALAVGLGDVRHPPVDAGAEPLHHRLRISTRPPAQPLVASPRAKRGVEAASRYAAARLLVPLHSVEPRRVGRSRRSAKRRRRAPRAPLAARAPPAAAVGVARAASHPRPSRRELAHPRRARLVLGRERCPCHLPPRRQPRRPIGPAVTRPPRAPRARAQPAVLCREPRRASRRPARRRRPARPAVAVAAAPCRAAPRGGAARRRRPAHAAAAVAAAPRRVAPRGGAAC